MTHEPRDPGWYDVGRNSEQLTVMRYWDGSDWTDDRRRIEATDDLIRMNQEMLRELRSIKKSLTVVMIVVLLPLVLAFIAIVLG